MPRINDHFLKLKAGYLFPEIARRVKAFSSQHPDAAPKIIRCGIGDVTEPLPKAARDAMHRAIDELGQRETFRGYGPEQGYDFLRTAIAGNNYRAHGMQIADDEIFVSDGSKCDTSNFLDLLGPGNRTAITDPVYPVYVDTNVMAGNTGPADAQGAYEGLLYLPCTEENDFVPAVPDEDVDVIYLCYPNNPTGATASGDQLAAWVEYARPRNAIILYDAAYEAFISDPDLPHSIYEIPGADTCAVEFRSFSKNGGFTGVRCAYTVVPKAIQCLTEAGEKQSLHPLWNRRMSTKFNGVSYPVQRGAEALFSAEGRAQVNELTSLYMGNAKLLSDACRELGLAVHGGENAPYIWVRCPDDISSWGMFDKMLGQAHVVITPGSGFGAAGEGYFRISAFNSRSNVEETCERIKALML